MPGRGPHAPGPPGGAGQLKADLRRDALRRRAARPAAHRDAAAAAIADHVVGLAGRYGARTVAGYVAVGGEPGTRPTLDRLRAAGTTVLLPVVSGDALDWAPYEGADALAPADRGLLEPTATRLGAAALGAADLVLAPALLVDRAGHRLGRGAGYYDRALSYAAAPVFAVVYDDEIVPALPSEPHDVTVAGAVCPRRVLRLGRGTAAGG